MPVMTLKDRQGRYWSISNNLNFNTATAFYSTTPATANWTASLAQAQIGSTFIPAADIVGNYLVVYYVTTTPTSTVSACRCIRRNGWRMECGCQCHQWMTGWPFHTGGIAAFVAMARGSVSWPIKMIITGNFQHRAIQQLQTRGAPSPYFLASADDTDPTLVNVGSDMYCFWSQYVCGK